MRFCESAVVLVAWTFSAEAFLCPDVWSARVVPVGTHSWTGQSISVFR